MKKVIAFLLVMVMVFSLAGCGGLNEVVNELPKDRSEGDASDRNNEDNKDNKDNEDNKDNDNEEEEPNSGSNSPSETYLKNIKKDKWPSSAFELFGIPEFTAAQNVYCVFYEEDGLVRADNVSALVNCTRSELIAYVDELLALGFQTADYNIENLQTSTWGSMDIYLPGGGGSSYYVYLYYSFDNEGMGGDMQTGEYVYDDDNDDYEEVTIVRNASISVHQYYDGPGGWNQEITLFEEFGIKDSDLRPTYEKAAKIMNGVQVSRYEDYDTKETTTVLLNLDTAFDYKMEEEFVYSYARQILKLFKSIDTDGELNELTFTSESPVVDVDADKPPFWVIVDYGGNRWTLSLGSGTEFGSSFTITLQRILE